MGRNQSNICAEEVPPVSKSTTDTHIDYVIGMRSRYGCFFQKAFSARPVVTKGELRQFTYKELMEDTIPIDNLDLDRLEWHLNEADLMEELCIERDFLEDLEAGDLLDRKYAARLTREQYLSHRSGG